MLLLGEGLAVVAAVYGQAAHGDVVGEALHLLVDLSRQLVGWHHDDAFHLRVGLGVGEEVDEREEVCGGLARARLGAGYEVVAVEDEVDALLLDRCALLEVHGIECIKDVVA